MGRPLPPVRPRLGLVAVVLLAGIGVSVLLATPVAATEPVSYDSGSDLSGNTTYEGQEVEVNLSTDFANLDEGDTIWFIETTEEQTIQTVTVDENQSVVFDSGHPNVNTDESTQYGLSNVTPTDADDDEQFGFTILEQEFDAEWETDTVTEDDEEVALELDSNRERYNITIAADGLDFEELNSTFIHPGSNLKEVNDSAHLPIDHLDFDREDDEVQDLRDDGFITLDLNSSGNFTDDDEIIANFSNLDDDPGLPDTGDYDFDIFVTDTTVDDTAPLTIGELRAVFDEDLYTRAAGDLLEITVDLQATDDAYVQFGDEDAGYVDILYLEDGDDSGEVSFTVNTRLAGTNHSKLDGIDPDDTEVVFFSEDDTVESMIHDQVIADNAEDVNDAEFWADSDLDDDFSNFEEYLEELGLIEPGEESYEQTVRPLQPQAYEIEVDRRKKFIAEDGTSSVDEAIGSVEFDLVQPSVRDVSTWVGPQDDADAETDIDDLFDELTERETVAIGDRSVVDFEATGVTGALATIDYIENDNDLVDGLEDGYSPETLHELAVSDDSKWVGDGIEFTFEEQDGVGHREPNTIDLSEVDDNDAYVLTSLQTAEGEPGRLVVVYDAADENFDRGVDDADRFTTELMYETDDDERFRFTETSGDPTGGAAGDTERPAFPYYPADFTRSERSLLTFEDPTVAYDRTDDGVVQMAPTEDSRISGWTNLAPGTDTTVGVRVGPPEDRLPEEDPSFLEERTVEITSDGSFSEELDLESRIVGEEGWVTFDVGEDRLRTVEGEFRDLDEVEGPFFETSVSAPASVDQGASIDVSTEVTNVGEEFGTADLRLLVDGELEESVEIDLSSTETDVWETSVTAESGGGPVDIVVSSQDTSTQTTVDVAAVGDEADDDEPEAQIDDESGDDFIPGFGAVGALAAVALSIALLRMSARRDEP